MPYFQNASNINIYGCTLNDFQGNPATLARMNEYLDDEERQKVMSWISRMDFYAKQVDVARRREPGTCQWILNDAVFQSWESDSKGALWCRGIPGAGKTIAASLIVDHLCAFQLRQPLGTIGVAWVYYNYKDQSAQTPEAIYLGLIRQLAAFSIELYGLLESVYLKDRNRPPPGLHSTSDIHTIIKEFKKVYIVVDALDECASESRDNILDLLSRFQGCGANILITSRDNVQESIDDSDLVNLRRMNIHGSTEDITTYVNARLENRLARIVRTRPSLKEEIVQKIVGLCNGMFLVATFHIESLRKAHNAGEVLESLKVLPKTIFGIYDDAMERIESHSDHARLALQILSFLTHARRPLSITELQHFLAVKPGHKEFHDEYVTDKDILVSICEGLIVIDDGTRIVRLVHLTAQEYFDRIRTSKFTEGDRDMGHACLIYLSFDVFRNPVHAPPQHYALLDYIANYWHLHILNHQVALEDPLAAFFKDAALLRAYSYFMVLYRDDYFSQLLGIVRDHSGLHAAAAAGLRHMVCKLLDDGTDVNIKDFTGRTPLIYASKGKFAGLVTFLVTRGADVNANDGEALSWALSHNHEAMVRLLLENGAHADIQGGKALWDASSLGHETFVRLLLGNRARVEAYNREGPTYSGEEKAVTNPVLGNRADVHAGEDRALWEASSGGHEAVVRLLLEHGAHVNAEEGMALWKASCGGHDAAAKLLLENGADVNAQEGRALWEASCGGHDAVVVLLLANGADVNARWGQALWGATFYDHKGTVQLLLEHGADANAGEGRALIAALASQSEAVVKLLVEHGAEVSVGKR